MTTIQFYRRLPNAQMPVRASEDAAAFDLFAAKIELVTSRRMIVDTGLNIAFPKGHVLYLHSRSGHGFKHEIRLTNGTGVIDPDYRGELKILLSQDGEHPFLDKQLNQLVKVGDRVAQAVLIPIPEVQWVEVDNLTNLGITARGEGGFGSTGTR